MIFEGKIVLRVIADKTNKVYTIILDAINEHGITIRIKIPRDAITNTFVDIAMYEDEGFRDSLDNTIVTKVKGALRKDWR